MRAERRVAEASLEAARAQLGRTEQERREACDAAAGARRRQRAGARQGGSGGKSTICRRSALPEQRRDGGGRTGPRNGGRSAGCGGKQLASARAALVGGKSEHDALARALEHGGGAAIASLKAERGYERALAAALGEDADAAIGGDGPRRWQGSGVLADDPALASRDIECLADHAKLRTSCFGA